MFMVYYPNPLYAVSFRGIATFIPGYCKYLGFDLVRERCWTTWTCSGGPSPGHGWMPPSSPKMSLNLFLHIPIARTWYDVVGNSSVGQKSRHVDLSSLVRKLNVSWMLDFFFYLKDMGEEIEFKFRQVFSPQVDTSCSFYLHLNKRTSNLFHVSNLFDFSFPYQLEKTLFLKGSCHLIKSTQIN